MRFRIPLRGRDLQPLLRRLKVKSLLTSLLGVNELVAPEDLEGSRWRVGRDAGEAWIAPELRPVRGAELRAQRQDQHRTDDQVHFTARENSNGSYDQT